ncbi:hypothetical protein ACFVDT_07075 [Streptomyces sp. NPDC057699]|uniref:hypothetical protein n=1 Tax=Streptomyces sp. NPDC057699 TaxID=3346220 RepID=UPI00368436C9
MMNQAMEMGDKATWVSAILAAIAILYTYFQNRQQQKSQVQTDELQRQASEIAARQAEATERRALATERMLAQFMASLMPVSSGPAGEEPDAGGSASSVDWSLSREGNLFVLRNEGEATATKVRVTVGDHPAGLTRRLPEDAVVRANEAVEFLVLGAWGKPVPRQIHVTWAGHEEPVAVPVPSQ